MKKIFILALMLFSFLFVSCSKKQNSQQHKKAVKTAKIDKKTTKSPEKQVSDKDFCKKFIPPWGDEYWETWGKAHMKEFEKWYVQIMVKMKSVKEFDAKRCGNLTNVFIGFSKIKDLTPFSKMPNLKKLDMRFNTTVSDLTPLKNLKHLEYLNIWRTKVTDLTPITSIPSLKRIDAKMTAISNISMLDKMPQLESIDLLQDPVEDISVFAKLNNIKELRFCTTKIKTLKPLMHLKKQITYLDLCNTHIKDFNKISEFTKVKTLKLWGLPIKSAKIFSKMKNLEWLDLWNTKISDIRPLFKLKHLKHLVIKGLKIPKKQIEKMKKTHPKIVIVEKDI